MPSGKSLTHCLTESFPIYQNKHWAIRWWDKGSVDPLSHRILLKIVGFHVSVNPFQTRLAKEIILTLAVRGCQ